MRAALGFESRQVKTGDVVEVKYRDHVFFKDADESLQTPPVMTARGLLSYEDDQFIRLKFEEYEDPDPASRIKVRSMGLVILKGAILEMRMVSGS